MKNTHKQETIIGIDLSDKIHQVCVLGENGETLVEATTGRLASAPCTLTVTILNSFCWTGSPIFSKVSGEVNSVPKISS